MKNSAKHWSYYAAAISLIALIIICVAWELWIAPLRPGGSWLALKALPLCLPLASILKGKVYTYQYSCMLILIYFAEAFMRIFNAVTGQPCMRGLGGGVLRGVFHCLPFFY